MVYACAVSDLWDRAARPAHQYPAQSPGPADSFEMRLRAVRTLGSLLFVCNSKVGHLLIIVVFVLVAI